MDSRDLNNFIPISASLGDSFFKYWVEFTWPIHRLSPAEMRILSCFLRERYFLSKKVSDEKLLDKIIFNTDIRKKIVEECQISKVFLSTKLGKFKKTGIIIDGKINPRLIPRIKDEKDFKLLIFFKLESNERRTQEPKADTQRSSRKARPSSKKSQ